MFDHASDATVSDLLEFCAMMEMTKEKTSPPPTSSQETETKESSPKTADQETKKEINQRLFGGKPIGLAGRKKN